MSYKTIRKDIIPCWYELGWQEIPPAIVLRIHKDFARDNSLKFNSQLPVIKHLQKEFNFKNFCPDLNGNFGFDDVFIYQKKESNFEEYKVLIPEIKKNTGKKCSDCKGSGKNTFYDSECHYCGGTGQKFLYDWQKARAISASFTLIFILLEFPENETSANVPQLMTVGTITKKGSQGGSLSGEFSLFLRIFLSSLWEGQPTQIIEMIQAMKVAYRFMFRQKEELIKYSFCAGISSKFGHVSTNCPGNTCGLDPDCGAGYEVKELGYGYKFGSHNVDSSAQQLTLLAGLAALHDKARKEIKNY